MHVGGTEREGGGAKEEVVEVVDGVAEREHRGQNPKESVGEGVENKRRGAETEWKTGIKVEGAQPLEAEERPFRRADRAETKCVFYVDLGEEGSGADVQHHGDSVIEGAVGHGELVGRDPGVNRTNVGVGEVKDEAIGTALFSDDAERGSVERLKRRSWEGTVRVAPGDLAEEGAGDLPWGITGGTEIGRAARGHDPVHPESEAEGETIQKVVHEGAVWVESKKAGQGGNNNRCRNGGRKLRKEGGKDRRRCGGGHRSGCRDGRNRSAAGGRSQCRGRCGRCGRRRRRRKVAARGRGAAQGRRRREADQANAGGHERAAAEEEDAEGTEQAEA